MAFCTIVVTVEGDNKLKLVLLGCAPVNSKVKKLAESKNGENAEYNFDTRISAHITPYDSEFVRNLAEEIESVIAPGAPRYDTPAFKYTLPKVSRCLRNFAGVLDQYTAKIQD